MAKFKVGDIWKAQVHFNSYIKKGNHILIQRVEFVPHKKYMGYDMNVLVLETGMEYVAYTDSKNCTRHFEKVETDVEPV